MTDSKVCCNNCDETDERRQYPCVEDSLNISAFYFYKIPHFVQEHKPTPPTWKRFSDFRSVRQRKGKHLDFCIINFISSSAFSKA